jgi:hypothetical protein
LRGLLIRHDGENVSGCPHQEHSLSKSSNLKKTRLHGGARIERGRSGKGFCCQDIPRFAAVHHSASLCFLTAKTLAAPLPLGFCKAKNCFAKASSQDGAGTGACCLGLAG